MLKTMTGLEEVEFFRPWEFAGQVELQVGQAAVRRWPKLRVALARQMLRSGRALPEIVTGLGFTDAAELRRSFCTTVGVAPEDYGASVLWLCLFAQNCRTGGSCQRWRSCCCRR